MRDPLAPASLLGALAPAGLRRLMAGAALVAGGRGVAVAPLGVHQLQGGELNVTQRHLISIGIAIPHPSVLN